MKIGESKRRQMNPKGVLAVICIMLFAVMLTGCGKKELDKDKFDIKLKYGYDNVLNANKFAPFLVEVTNNGSDFSGNVQLIIPNDEGNTLYEKEISLQAGTTKTVQLVGEVVNSIHYVNIRLTDNKNNVVWKDLYSVTVEDEKKDLNVGILSDDYSALGYMDRQVFPLYPGNKTRIYELREDTFPDDAHALDMLDVIVISDFSTDILSDNQIAALRIWTGNGGMLIVGTGSTYNKTLSKLNHDFFEVTPGELKKYSTKFGLSLIRQASALPETLYEDQSPYGNSKYESEFETVYANELHVLEEYYLDDFLGYEGYTQEEYENDQEGYIKESFYWYCFEQFFYQFYLYGLYLEDFDSKTEKQNEYPYVEADVLTLSGDSLNNAAVFEGELENSTATFPLGYTLPMGSGYVFLSTVDFTKNPLTRYEGNEDIFIYIVQETLGETIAISFDDYSYYETDFLSSLSELAGGAQIPPAIIYLLLILGFLIAMIVLFATFRKKGKSVRLWIVYPIVSFAIAIIIFCAGFSTRLIRPLLNVVSVLELQGTVISKESILAVTVPKNKEYEVSVSKNYALSDAEDFNDYYYWEESECDYDSYTSAYEIGMDDNTIRITNTPALDSRKYRLQTTFTTDKKVEVKHTAADVYEVTNNYGCDLEAAYILVNDKLYYLGHIENGETMTISEFEYCNRYYIENKVGSSYTAESGFSVISGLLFGSLSPAFEKYILNQHAIAASDAYIGKLDGYYSEVHNSSFFSDQRLFFAACPDKVEKGVYQQSTKYRERCAECIVFVQDNAIQSQGN